MSYWMNGVVSGVFVIIGVIGNISMMISFHCSGQKRTQRRRQAFYYYLVTFAGWNTGLLLATILFNCLPVLLIGNYGPASGEYFHLWSVSYLVGYLLGNCCVTADSWLAVVVTIERYLAVTRPLRTRVSSPRRRAKFICILSSVLAVVYNLPLVFEFSLYEVQYDDTAAQEGYRNLTWEEKWFLKLYLSPMRDSSVYKILYRVVANFLFVSIIPFTVVLLLTIRIVFVVREADRNRSRFRKATAMMENRPDAALACLALSSSKSSTPLTSKYRQMDLLLTMIAGKFLLFYTLPVVINIVEVAIDPKIFELEDSYEAKLLHFCVDLSNLLIVIDGATNSFFYFSWRNRFSGHSRGWSTSQRSTFMESAAGEGQIANDGPSSRQRSAEHSRANSIFRTHRQFQCELSNRPSMTVV